MAASPALDRLARGHHGLLRHHPCPVRGGPHVLLRHLGRHVRRERPAPPTVEAPHYRHTRAGLAPGTGRRSRDGGPACPTPVQPRARQEGSVSSPRLRVDPGAALGVQMTEQLVQGRQEPFDRLARETYRCDGSDPLREGRSRRQPGRKAAPKPPAPSPSRHGSPTGRSRPGRWRRGSRSARGPGCPAPLCRSGAHGGPASGSPRLKHRATSQASRPSRPDLRHS